MKIQKFIRNTFYSFISACILLSTGCGNVFTRESSLDSYVLIADSFKNPSADYRTAPFMVWNGKVTKSEIDRMLQELKDAGCGGAFVHPRPGLITEYMSEEWYELFRHCVEKGKEIGLNVWIYDENSYPSGFAGGHVPDKYPESYNQGQGLAMKKFEFLPENTNDYFLFLHKDKEIITDITNSLSDYKNQKGDYYLYKKTFYETSDWYGGFSYVDLIAPGVTEKFMNITMKGYEKVAKNEFGKGVKGIFTDEPNLSGCSGIRWTPDLFQVFENKWGYDLKTSLPLLSEKIGNWKEVRHNYIETLLQLFIDRWSKPWHQYCKTNGLIWTGHYWEHGWPEMRDGGDNMAMYAWHQIPAIDMLFNQFDEISPQAQFGNIRAVKELRSVANQMGYSRTLSETYGGGGWEVTFKDLKRLGDWEYVLGVNMMNQHLSHMTLTGARKYDYPPVFTYHSPWWPHYKILNDYYGRLSMILSKGLQQNNILVIEPTSTLWEYFSYDKSEKELMEIGLNFQSFVTLLEKSQVEYDLGSENIIKDQGRISGNKFMVGKSSYSTVVLPPQMENLDMPTFLLLREFVKNGGRLITYATPTRVSGKESHSIALFLKENNTNIIKEIDLTTNRIKSLFADKSFNIDFSGGNLYHQRRKYKDGELLFLVNSSMDNATIGNLTIEGKTLLALDAMTGKINTYPARVMNGKIKTSFKLPPTGSLLLFSLRKKESKYEIQTTQQYKLKELTASNETVVKRMRENVLLIDFCDVIVNGKANKNVHFSSAADIIFKEHGFLNGNPWNTSVQYKRNILDRDTLSSGGFIAKYHFSISGKVDYEKMKLVSERPEIFSVKVNGKSVSIIPGAWWLDKSFGVYEIGQFVKKGNNTVEINVSPMSIYAELEPIYILGDFSIVPDIKGWSITTPKEKLELGSWKEQNQPFYSWEMSYSKDYTIDDTNQQCFVKLNKWKGTVTEVFVNNRSAGIIAFDPFELNITPYLTRGNNFIEVRVTGSLKNLLGPHHKNPAPGLVSPWHWKGVDKIVSGKDYQLIDYGLLEDFIILQAQ